MPRDYDTPDGPKVTIGMSRHRAKSAATKIGSLLINPGGPGGTGRDFMFSVVQEAPADFAEVISRFDIIGFDPRGIGASGQIVCLADKELDKIYLLDITPETPAERAESDKLDTDFDNGCLASVGRDGLLATSTENVARDMNEIRSAVGDKGLSYFGVSYGTFLGATFATLFPNDVRALVLDGAYDPTGQDLATQEEISQSGREDAFHNWVTWCESSALCAFGEGGNVDARWLALRERLDNKSIGGKDGRAANQGVLLAGTGISLYDRKFGWIALGAALKNAEAGNGELLLRLADAAYGRGKDGKYDGRIQAGGAIRCSSGITPPPASDPASAKKRIEAASSHFAIGLTEKDLTDSGCGKLPTGPQAKPFAYSGSAPVLVVGGTNDPATPFVWATKMAGSLGPSAQLLTFEGEGHGALLESGCVSKTASALLVELTTPDAPVTCRSAGAERAVLPTWYSEFPKIPGAVDSVDVNDLIAALGFDTSKAAVIAKLSSRGNAIELLLSRFEAKGWSLAKDGSGVLEKTMGGIPRRVILTSVDLAQLAELEPMLEPVAKRLAKSGPAIVLIFQESDQPK